MYNTWNKERDRSLSLNLATMAATALALFPRRGHAFHSITSNIGRSSAARHASSIGAQAQQQQQQQQQQQRIRKMIACLGIRTCSTIKDGAVGVASSTIRRVSRLGMVAWEAPPNGRDVDRGFSSGRVTGTTLSDSHNSGKDGRSTRRGDGDGWNTESYSDRGSRSREEVWDSSRSGRRGGRHDRSFDSSRTSSDRRQGGHRDGDRRRSFGDKRGPSKGPGRRNGSHDQVWANERGRQDPVQARGGYTSKAWDEEGSAPASEWMRGALSDVQGELSPKGPLEEDTNFDMVYGIAPVLNALRNRRREKLELYCQDGLTPANKKDRAAANTIYDLAQESDVMTTTTDKGYLNSLCGNRPHQGFVLKARPLEFEPILFLPSIQTANPGDSDTSSANVIAKDRTPSTTPAPAPSPIAAGAPGNVWLALDEVTDPQNFGALLRSAHFFGAKGVVTCAKNSASLTATVSKASAGAVEVMRVHSTANMMRFLRRSRENGWRIVGTAVSESSVPLRELPVGPDAPPTIVVLGNEGYGVRASVVRECDVLVEVTGEGGGATADGVEPSTVDSLNVSVTGGVVLFHLLMER